MINNLDVFKVFWEIILMLNSIIFCVMFFYILELFFENVDILIDVK